MHSPLHSMLRARSYIETSEFDAFSNHAFAVTNPCTPLDYNWHHRLLTELLELARLSLVRRIIINVPPRSLKSQYISVSWPAWLLAKDPSARIMTASYTQKLSEKHALDCRNLMLSPFYRSAFPGTILAPDQNQKHKFATTLRGYRFSTSIGGTVTGEGGNFLIIDDPHNPADIHSPSQRKRTIDWFEQSWASRLDDKNKGVMVLVMQRLHHEDLTGYLLEKSADQWVHLNLPLINPHTLPLATDRSSYRRFHDQLLHPARDNMKTVEHLQHELGSHYFAAQYQQMPITFQGNMISRQMIHTIPAPDRSATSYIVQSWDTASQVSETSDYSVCCTWAVVPEGYILLDVLRERLTFPTLLARMQKMAEDWQPKTILIERQSSGQAAIQSLATSGLPIVPILPKYSKIYRMLSVSSLFESGKVHIVQAPWTQTYIEELLNFPTTTHDDQVDASTQFLFYMMHKQFQNVPNIRRL